MRKKYPVSLLCRLLDVSRSGYYKWRRRRGIKNRYEKDRELLTELLYSHHLRHPSYGYHRLSVSVFRETGWIFSHNLAHKCCKQAGIHSKARKHGKYRKPGEESIRFPNIVRGKWHPKEPLQIVTSDMTMFRSGGKQYEWTLLIDAFNNEILAHKVSDKPGDNRPYYHVLEELLQLSKKANDLQDEMEQLKQVENELRQMTGMAPAQDANAPAAQNPDASGNGDGKHDGQGGPVVQPDLNNIGQVLTLVEQGITQRRESLMELQQHIKDRQEKLGYNPLLGGSTTPSIWPAHGDVSSPFGLRWNGSDFHPGIDIANDMGTPIVATADGIVTTAGWNSGGYGNMVDIDHGNGII